MLHIVDDKKLEKPMEAAATSSGVTTVRLLNRITLDAEYIIDCLLLCERHPEDRRVFLSHARLSAKTIIKRVSEIQRVA